MEVLNVEPVLLKMFDVGLEGFYLSNFVGKVAIRLDIKLIQFPLSPVKGFVVEVYIVGMHPFELSSLVLHR